jgi:hypothetical protein
MTNENNGNRILLVTQIFTIILVLKGISATYLATKYAIQGQIELVNHYVMLARWIPVALLIPLILISLPLIFNIDKKAKKILDIIGLVIFFIFIILLIIL